VGAFGIGADVEHDFAGSSAGDVEGLFRVDRQDRLGAVVGYRGDDSTVADPHVVGGVHFEAGTATGHGRLGPLVELSLTQVDEGGGA
jgi:hypothetical protein